MPIVDRSTAVYWWAVAGVCALFAEAIVQLGRRGIATLRAGLEPEEWLALVLLSAAFLYGEGVGALERRWVPGLVARARELSAGSARWQRALAPLYAMSLVGAERKSSGRAWLGVGLIILAVLLVRALPEPWRGIVDFAVALALLWGLGAIVRQSIAGRDRG